MECDSGQKTSDGKRVCGPAFCIFCKEKWNIGQDRLYIYVTCFNTKEGTNKDTEDAEVTKNVEATFVDISEAAIKKMKVNELKTEINSCRLTQGGLKVVLRD